MANLMKQTEERHSESRMRAIRTSGSMRGSPPKTVIGVRAFHSVWISLLYSYRPTRRHTSSMSS